MEKVETQFMAKALQELKSKQKSLLKCFLTILFLVLSINDMSPGMGVEEDPKEIGTRAQKMKREHELNEFNDRLKNENPDLFVLAMRESALPQIGDTVPNYKVYNKLGYIGAWQIHVDYLPSLGIHGVTFDEFKEDPDGIFPFEVQLYAIQQLVENNKEYLGWYLDYYPGKNARGVSKITEEGMLYAAHLGGAYGLKKFLKYGYNPSDINGTSIKDYLNYKNTFLYQLD